MKIDQACLATITNWDFSTLNRHDLEPQFIDRIELIALAPGVFHEETGWTWTLRFIDGSGEVEPREVTYRTNASYEGIYSQASVGWNQETGNGQFSLSRNRATAIRQIVNRWSDKYSEKVYH